MESFPTRAHRTLHTRGQHTTQAASTRRQPPRTSSGAEAESPAAQQMKTKPTTGAENGSAALWSRQRSTCSCPEPCCHHDASLTTGLLYSSRTGPAFQPLSLSGTHRTKVSCVGCPLRLTEGSFLSSCLGGISLPPPLWAQTVAQSQKQGKASSPPPRGAAGALTGKECERAPWRASLVLPIQLGPEASATAEPPESDCMNSTECVVSGFFFFGGGGGEGRADAADLRCCATAAGTSNKRRMRRRRRRRELGQERGGREE